MKRRRVLLAGVALAATSCGGPVVVPNAAIAPAPPPPPTPAPEPAAAAPALPSASTEVPAPAPVRALERVVARIGQNHGHVFEVTLADIAAGAPRTYDLKGSSGHGHSVTLDADAFKRIRAGEVVRLPSTRVGHLHRLLVRLAPAVEPKEAANVCEIKIGGKDDHDLVITAADLAARAERSYDIQGIAPHNHVLRVKTEDFERLAKGEAVALNSSMAAPDGDHFHVVFIRSPAGTPG